MMACQSPESGIMGTAGCIGICAARTRSVAVAGNGHNDIASWPLYRDKIHNSSATAMGTVSWQE